MNELPQKTSRFTPTVIVSAVLLLTFILLEIRLLLRTTQTSQETLFPDTLFFAATSVIILMSLESAHRTIRIALWIIMIFGYLVLLATYLNLKIF